MCPIEPNTWSAAIFAHNEADNIIACLDAVLGQRSADKNPIFVLINGSHDDTEKIVHDYVKVHSNVVPVKISVADKANAWNEYVHNLSTPTSTHFFIDGDTRPMSGAFASLIDTLSMRPDARAAGALPASGRDRLGWSRRMTTFGRLAGCLYALRGSYVAELRRDRIRLPIGLIGEDLFLSCMVKDWFDNHSLMVPSPYLVFAPDAGFWFRSLSPLRFTDWFTYGRRLVRYQIRDYQLVYLLSYLSHKEFTNIPINIDELYCNIADVLPLFQWRGRMTPFHFLAVLQIRNSVRRIRDSNPP
jgi:glycosyltransferase involved in cell wall biosynthesis